MSDEGYRPFWEHVATTPQGALAAVDGSADEETVQTTGRWTAEQVAHALLLQPGDHVLELGCGVARIGRELAPRCGRWQGVDIAENMLRVARGRTAHLPNVAFHHLTRTGLSMFADDTFDKAYSVAVLIHLDKEDVFLYLRELTRVLRPGGLLYFDAWNLAHPVGWQRWMMEVEQWAGADQRRRKDAARNQFFAPQEVQVYVRNAGLAELFCLTDSPWVQMIAAKPGPQVDVAGIRERARAQLAAVAFTPLWGRLFGSLLEVYAAKKAPRVFWRELDLLGGVPEVAPYRQHVLALWKTRQHDWGPLPPG